MAQPVHESFGSSIVGPIRIVVSYLAWVCLIRTRVIRVTTKTATTLPDEAGPEAGPEAGTDDDPGSAVRDQYLRLLQRALTFSLWDAADGEVWEAHSPATRLLERLARRRGVSVVKSTEPHAREDGEDRPRLAHTMAGDRRLAHLRDCIEQILRDEVPGDLVETGVWRGGTCIFMRGVLFAHGVTDRAVWVADSFAGPPKPDTERYPADAGDTSYASHEWAVPLEEVRATFARYGLLDDQVRFLPGWFDETLQTAPIDRLAVLRVDGEMYASTMQALETLYPKLAPGGFCIVDDFGSVETCRQAVEDYRLYHQITATVENLDADGVYWRKPGVKVT
jgi:O-methyltransferase